MGLFDFFKKGKAQSSDPDYLVFSQYSDMPRFYVINGITFDIDNPNDIKKIPIIRSTFNIRGREYSMDLLLEKHGLQARSLNTKIYQAAIDKANEYHANSIILAKSISPDFANNDASQVTNISQESSHISNDAEDIDKMDGHQFELWCANLLPKLGYSNVRLTGKSGDQGVDLLAEKDGVRYAIQCKCYSSPLGNTPIQEVNTGKVIYRCHVAAVLTNQRFTDGGRKAADATGVLLWDRDWINRAIGSITSANSTEQHTDANVYFQYSDDLLPTAVDVILEAGQASVNVVQRHLNIGYARAARIIDELEDKGIVGPFQGSKPRDILITKAQWAAIRSGYGIRK